MQATGEAVQDFVAFAEEKTRDGSIAKTHFVIPSWRRLRKWFASVFGGSDDAEESSNGLAGRGGAGNVVFVGHGWTSKKDPEHRAPKTTWQRVGNRLRLFSNFFGSPESVFGFRVVCATMTVGIVAFLEETQRFFMEQRLVWAMIIIAIGMTQSMFPACLTRFFSFSLFETSGAALYDLPHRLKTKAPSVCFWIRTRRYGC